MADEYIVAKCLQPDKTIAMYVIALHENVETKYFGGSAVAKRVENCKHVIYKLDYKISDVISFSCGR